MPAFVWFMSRHNGERQQQLVLDQIMQFKGFFTHFQRVIAFRQVFRSASFTEHGVGKLAMNRNLGSIQTALANHLHYDIQRATDDQQTLLIPAEPEYGMDFARITGQRLAKTLELTDRPAAFKNSFPIGKFARIDVRWNRPFQHKRAILGTPLSTVKENSSRAAPAGDL